MSDQDCTRCGGKGFMPMNSRLEIEDCGACDGTGSRNRVYKTRNTKGTDHEPQRLAEND